MGRLKLGQLAQEAIAEESIHSASESSSSSGLYSEVSSSSSSSISSFPSSISINSRSSSSCSDSPSADHDFLCSYRCLRTISQGHQASVTCLALHGDILCSGSRDSQIRVWRHSDATELARLRPKSDQGAIKALLMAGDKLFTAHQDNKITVWRFSKSNLTQHSLIASLPTVKDCIASYMFSKEIQHKDAVSALALGDKVVYSGSWDKTVKVWRLSDLKCLESIRAHDNAVNALAANFQMGLLYTGSADSKIKVWERRETPTTTNKQQRQHHILIAVLRGHEHTSVNALALNPNGTLLYSGSSDSSIAVWERQDGPCHMSFHGLLRGHKNAVLCLATTADLLCSGSADRTIRVWRRGSDGFHSCLALLEGHRGPVKSVALSMDRFGCCNVHSGSLDSQIKIWRVSSPYGEEDYHSEHFSSIDDADSTTVQWKLNAIKYVLDEGAAADSFQLAFQTLQCHEM